MDNCICGAVNKFKTITTYDIGFDHHNYICKKTKKEYNLCKNCNSIIRSDTQIINPFKKQYFYTAKSCKTASERLNQISNFISNFAEKDIKHICDFGGADGQLLNILSKRYRKASLSSIELNFENQSKNGINYYDSLTKAMSDNKVDILIASNSLLYTTYKELTSIIQDKNIRPKFIFISGPNFQKRPAQLFYDDVIYNASIFGIKKLLQRFGYEIIEASKKYRSVNEYLIGGIDIDNNDKTKLLQDNQTFDLKMQKEYILKVYKQQAKKFNQDKSVTIFGTSIDSAILCNFLNCEYNFAKDITFFDETFINRPVYQTNTLRGEIVIPILMNNRKVIIEKLKKENNHLIIKD